MKVCCFSVLSRFSPKSQLLFTLWYFSLPLYNVFTQLKMFTELRLLLFFFIIYKLPIYYKVKKIECHSGNGGRIVQRRRMSPGDDTGKEKQRFYANRENGLELEPQLVWAAARTSERNRLKVQRWSQITLSREAIIWNKIDFTLCQLLYWMKIGKQKINEQHLRNQDILVCCFCVVFIVLKIMWYWQLWYPNSDHPISAMS